jgi:hypothetical protein
MSSAAEVPSGAVKQMEIDQGRLRQPVDGLVRDAVEDTLNALLDAEADALFDRRPTRRMKSYGHSTNVSCRLRR